MISSKLKIAIAFLSLSAAGLIFSYMRNSSSSNSPSEYFPSSYSAFKPAAFKSSFRDYSTSYQEEDEPASKLQSGMSELEEKISAKIDSVINLIDEITE
jgi:hypothetical protein